MLQLLLAPYLLEKDFLSKLFFYKFYPNTLYSVYCPFDIVYTTYISVYLYKLNILHYSTT